VFEQYMSLTAKVVGVFACFHLALGASGVMPEARRLNEEAQMLTNARVARGNASGIMDNALLPRFVSLDTGVRLEYVERGPDHGMPVILLHGVTDSWRSFEMVLARLPASIHAFAISQRGHGDSSRPEIGYRFRDMSEDLRAFMDAKGLGRAVVVGHSMGASVAQRFLIDHPERLIRVVLMGAFADINGNAAVGEFVKSQILPLTDPIAPEFAREWQASTVAHPVQPRFFETVVQETLKVPARVWHQTFTGFLSTPGFTHELARANRPVLLIWGDQDTYTLRKDQDTLLKAIPGARLVVYEGIGHALHWEDPERVVATLVDFVDSRGN
jgi:pimeloyl-ACP methyl ester carboxylesterase